MSIIIIRIVFFNFVEILRTEMKEFNNRCFVCKTEINPATASRNSMVNLPVCNNCKGTKKEKETEEEYLDSLADGLVCGCI